MVMLAPFRPGGECPSSLSLAPSLSLQLSLSMNMCKLAYQMP